MAQTSTFEPLETNCVKQSQEASEEVTHLFKEEPQLKGRPSVAKIQDETTVSYRTFGYARVSSQDQNLDRQINAFLEFGIDRRNIYADKASGKDFNRPKYRSLVRKLKTGDVLVIKSIDRLGRNYEEILEEWRYITKRRKASIVVLDMPLLDTRASKGNVTGVLVADIVLQLLSYVAEVERELTRQRQAEGIAAAKARGVKFGRPRKQKPVNWPQVRKDFLDGRMTKRQAAAFMGISKTTFDSWMKE